jgi:tetratricopeptide (TPR) repeat protein
MILCAVSTESKQALMAAIDQEYRLGELVVIQDAVTPDTDMVISGSITVLPGWKNEQPPVLFPPVAFSPTVCIGLIYALLGNMEKASELLADYPLLLEATNLLFCIQQAQPLSQMETDALADLDYYASHNRAISFHYGAAQQPIGFEQLAQLYNAALQKAGNDNNKAFTAKHYAVLLTDAGLLQQAETLLEATSVLPLEASAANDIKNALCHVWMQQLTIPYDTALLEKLKTNLWECLQYYEANQQAVEAGLVLTDAAHIATIGNSFSEALGYCTRAIAIFENAELTELAAQAQLRKAALLQTWAQHGNPQFYRSSMQAYLAALQVFTREAAPAAFADIQHQLGKVYAEIPDEIKKKGVWAAVSVSSFTEALNFYNKVDYPYEFAMICHSFGNAYTKYPAALHSDNFDKALAWYREALDVRTPELYPLERVLTLSNYLEASWYVGNKTEFDEDRYNDMVAKATEICSLSNDEAICAAAREHLRQLSQLKQEAGTTN